MYASAGTSTPVATLETVSRGSGVLALFDVVGQAACCDVFLVHQTRTCLAWNQ